MTMAESTKAYMQAYESWVNSDYFDEDTKAELKAIEGDEAQIRERFFSEPPDFAV